MSYAEGFEDAVELCLHEIEAVSTVEGIKEKIRQIVQLVKENKFDRIKHMLAAL